MSYYPKERWNWSDVWPTLVVVALVLCAPIGIAMAFYTDNAEWLWLCAAWIIFLS